jgi:hypothetical protein
MDVRKRKWQSTGLATSLILDHLALGSTYTPPEGPRERRQEISVFLIKFLALGELWVSSSGMSTKKKNSTKKTTAKNVSTAKDPEDTSKTTKRAVAKRRASKAVVQIESDARPMVEAVRTTAYFLAEGDGFQRDSVHYWLEAEQKSGLLC